MDANTITIRQWSGYGYLGRGTAYSGVSCITSGYWLGGADWGIATLRCLFDYSL